MPLAVPNPPGPHQATLSPVLPLWVELVDPFPSWDLQQWPHSWLRHSWDPLITHCGPLLPTRPPRKEVSPPLEFCNLLPGHSARPPAAVRNISSSRRARMGALRQGQSSTEQELGTLVMANWQCQDRLGVAMERVHLPARKSCLYLPLLAR